VIEMGRLFWKFLFSYWAALLIAVAGTAGAVWLYGLTMTDSGSTVMGGPRADFMVGTAAATGRHGGVAALRALLSEMPRKGPPPLLAVDERGSDLLDRTVPADSLARARALHLADARSRSVRSVQLPDGHTYLLFVAVHELPLRERIFQRDGRPSPFVPLTAGLIASLAFGALLAWYVAQPVRHLRAAFASLAEGKLATRVAPLIGSRRDEVADLGRDFDRMAQRLQALIASQRSLLHDVSHELRSPLARLQAAIGLARQNPQKVEATLERIERECERLDDLVGELLTLARLEAGAEGGTLEQLQETDLVDLVAEVAADARFEAEASERSLTFSSEGEVVANVRPTLLQRAVENVARNAVKFTAPATAVEIATRSAPARDVFCITIADRGSGVPEAELEAIFEPFYRGSQRSSVAGFGLGLAIARRAVEMHGGRIRALNRAGGGLEIEILVPLP
jgi:two-component system, OmpR family, sensor kinase